MKNIRLIALTAAILLSGCIITNAQTVAGIIQKHLIATGGLDRWRKIKTLKVAGSLTLGGKQLPISITTINGKGTRTEFSVNGMVNYTILTPTNGWSCFPIEGHTKPEAMATADVKEAQDQLDIQGPLIDYPPKGIRIVYQGKGKVGNIDCFVLKVTYPTGKIEVMYIDASNYYHIRSIEKTYAGGKEQERTINYGNYKKLPEGVVVPMMIEDETGPMEIKTVEINKPVDENIFIPGK